MYTRRIRLVSRIMRVYIQLLIVTSVTSNYKTDNHVGLGLVDITIYDNLSMCTS